MRTKIILSVSIVFLILSTSFAFGQQITIDSNKQSFSAGDVIELSGKVEDGQGKPVTLEVKDPSGQTILIRTVQADEGGNFELKFKLPSTVVSGTYDIIATSEINGETITQIESISQSSQLSSSTDSGGGCLIATAAFGTEMAPQVQLLREVRDNVLFSTSSGIIFMTGFNSIYYSFSPTIADWERDSPVFKEVVKTAITPMLSTLSILNYVEIDSEQEMLGYGITVILLNVGMYFVAPTVLFLALKRR